MNIPEISLPLGPAINDITTCANEMSRFADAGLKQMVVNVAALMKMYEDEAYRKEMVSLSNKLNITFRDAHAPHGLLNSIGVPAPIEVITNSLKKAIEISGILGIKTLTIHAGRTRLVGDFALQLEEFLTTNLPAAKERIIKSLDILLPIAEKNNVILAVENLFLPSTTANFITPIVEEYNTPSLGLCYDSGHALIVEKQEGKTSDDIAKWIRCGWDDDIVTFQDFQLERMKNFVVTTHFHDNDGKNDLHIIPGKGIANWKRITNIIKTCPRLVSLQAEPIDGLYNLSAKELIDSFDVMNKEW